MLVHDTTPSASYQANRQIKRLKAAAQAQWGEGTFLDVNEVEIGSPFTLRFYFTDGAAVTQVQAQALVDAHDNAALMAAEQDAAQVANANASMISLLSGLAQLTAEDAAYALMGRAMAHKDGASQAVIDGIVDRATAAAYLTGKTEWVNLPAAAKAWLADHLDMEAVLFQAVIIVLRR
jgi:hypothetical protein